MVKPIFVAATRQHVGKTTVSLALMSGLKKKFGKVGFMKPVGQQHVPVSDGKGGTLRVDKDVQLLKDYFQLDHMEWPDTSPVLVPKDYTKAFIDGGISLSEQIRTIRNAFSRACASSDLVLLEGTGHGKSWLSNQYSCVCRLD